MYSKEEAGQPKPTFADVPTGTIREVLELCTGHNILSTEALIERGIPEAIIQPLVSTHESSRRSPSSMIFANDGGVLGAATGVYDLELLNAICRDYGVSTDTPYMGRGYQARDLRDRLTQHFEKSIPDAFK